jgi:hypothetical protein
MSLLGAHAWWMPRWLDRIVPQLRIEGGAAAPEDASVAAAPGDGGGDTATEPSGSTGNGQAPSRTKLRRPAKRADRRTRRRDKAGTSRN